MFLFQISNYDEPALDIETAQLLCQRLEAHSRRALPGMWKVTDSMNNYAGEGPGRKKRQGRFRVYGVILIALGIFVLVPGLVEPREPALILAGAVAIIAGLLSLFLARKEKADVVPASCKKEAEKLLEGRRAIDWNNANSKVEFDEKGMTISFGENRETVSYDQISEMFESKHLWLLIYGSEKALLLQKKDLVSGDADLFTSQILEKAKVN